MAKVINTGSLAPGETSKFNPEEQDWIYCGLDCCLTAEINGILDQQLMPITERTYRFDFAMQGPALAMMARGFLIDQAARAENLYNLDKQFTKVDSILQRLAEALWGSGLNQASPKQLMSFFYDFMQLPIQYKNVKGERRPTTDREALEKLREIYFYTEPFINCILKLRDIAKLIGILKLGVDSDGRMRCGYRPKMTETGRWASNKNAFGTGTNFQNITNKMRRMFVADPGKKLAEIDLAQAESRAVAYLARDEAYIAACESGDLHTFTARLVWKDVVWTGDDKRDKALAEQIFYRHFSRRDLAKRGGHASNYVATPFTIAKHLKIEKDIAEEFQSGYFEVFSGIRRYHHNVQELIQASGKLTTSYGRQRYFFGRLHDDATLREAVAYTPQSIIVDNLDLGLMKVWQELDLHEGRIQVLNQVHDSFVYQFDENDDEVHDCVLALMNNPIFIHGRALRVPVEIKVGYTWCKDDMAPRGSPNAALVRRKEVSILDIAI